MRAFRQTRPLDCQALAAGRLPDLDGLVVLVDVRGSPGRSASYRGSCHSVRHSPAPGKSKNCHPGQPLLVAAPLHSFGRLVDLTSPTAQRPPTPGSGAALPPACQVPSRRPGNAQPRGRPWAALDATAPDPSQALPTGIRVVALGEVGGMARPHPGDLLARRGHALLCSLGSPAKRGDPAFDQLMHSLKLRLCVIHHPSLAVSSSQEIHGHLVYFPGLRCYI